MKETTDTRWLKWDLLFNEGKYEQIVEEFDKILKDKKNPCLGDLIRRNDALEQMGILIFWGNSEIHKKQREKNGKSK